MSLRLEEVEHIAHLAHLRLAEAEKLLYREQLSAILEYAARVQAVDTDNTPPLASILGGQSGLRSDVPLPGLGLDDLLQNAPAVAQDQFLVPPVLASNSKSFMQAAYHAPSPSENRPLKADEDLKSPLRQAAPSLFDGGLIETIQALRRGQFSSQELVQDCLERSQQLEPTLHAFITLAPEQALAQSREADRRLSAYRKDPSMDIPLLLGLPLAVKDILCVAGLPCTCGSRILEGFVPPYHATAIERLLAAGVVIVGKTNMDEFAMGSSTENSAFGPSRNPWNLNRVPGGSSGGSAAAVAARLVPAALGSDTGGSIRQPAAFCGLTGLKPTYGRISRWGLVAYGSSLDTVGVLAHSAGDAAWLLRVMAGSDRRDPTSLDLPMPALPSEEGLKDLAGLRIGMPREYFLPGLQIEVESLIRQAIEVFTSFGATVCPVSLPHTSMALPVYYLIAPAEASANLARYDGVRYGARLAGESLWELFDHTRGELLGPEVKRRIMLGAYALSAGYYDAYYGQAQKVRTLIWQDFENAFAEVDVIAAPVAPTTAFPIGAHGDDPLAMYLEDIFTLPANLAGIPSLAFPVGFDTQGLPVGMQLMAGRGCDDLLLKAAAAYQQVTDWHLRKPGDCLI